MSTHAPKRYSVIVQRKLYVHKKIEGGILKTYTVGDGVTAGFNDKTGTVLIHSDNGTLWPDWLEKLGTGRDEIVSIRVTKGTVHMPKKASALFKGLANLKALDLKRFDSSGTEDMNISLPHKSIKGAHALLPPSE